MSFSFGTPSSAPATTGLSGGFNFGANKPATPGFGLGATSQPSTGLFGTPATSAPAFGTTTPAFGSTFGATSTAQPTFGASTTPAFGATATPAFGATTTPAFGATATPAFGATTTPAFGTTATPAFGATSAAPAFGATSSAPAFGAASTAPTFGTATPAFGSTSSAPAFGTAAPTFGASSAAPAFGTTTPAFGAANTSFGTGLGTGGLSFGTAATTASTGLSFGTTTTTSAGLGGLGSFGFGATTTAQSGLGLFASTTTTSSSFATPSLGLGGAVPTSGTTGASDGKTEPPKQTKLPNEIGTTVESFKEFVKKQKSLSSDIMRVSIKPLQKVSREAECTLRAALSLCGETSRCRAQSRRLRASAAAALAAAETAAREPLGSELEGITPPTYVKELISELEQQIITFRRQMDVADKQMQSSPKLLTEQELTLGIRRMHESLVALAGRLQAVHSQVEAQKEQYLNLRKYVLKDPTNVFETQSANASLDQILRDAEGTRKKTKSGNFSDVGLSSAVLSDPRAALGNIRHLAGPTPFTYLGSTLSTFPVAETPGSNWQPTPQPNLNASMNTTFGAQADAFQLQKPPGKRGKQ
ncbi:nuclear pore complex protein Nup58-like [Zerene cesonia]|uniref:nuclear pore complex protein Nup58-like n=1 Tax=Zerene cesonia TaxID=33412 RepID=UPI0018E4F0E6|nr:nuclear pore complex protein Nup58-like [Zerene cesonia]